MKIVDGWLDVASEVDYGDKSFGPFEKPPNFIVIHGTASPGNPTADDIARYFQTVDDSVHLIVDRNGNICQGLSMLNTCWGAGGLSAGHASFLPDGVNPNMYTLQVEHVMDVNNGNGLTDVQKNASFSLISLICDTYHIPRIPGGWGGGIIRHSDIDPVNRPFCPNTYPMDELFQYLSGVNQNTPTPTDQELTLCWHSTKALFGGTPPRDGTGIWQSWKDGWLNGKQYGPPLSQEYDSPNMSGDHIVVQEFAHARCEWDPKSSTAKWYSIGGQI